MSADALIALSPLIIVSGTAVVVMLAIAARRKHRNAAGVSVFGLALALAVLPTASAVSPGRIAPLLTLDRYAFLYMGLIFAATLAVALLAYGYLERRSGNREEFYVLLVLAALGSAVLAAASHFASFFLGLELLSVSLYALIAYSRVNDDRPVEAGLKYLVLAGASSAFLLFGMALLYARFGEMEFSRLGRSIAAAGGYRDAFLLLGSAMVLTGIGFKLGVVPFHMWTPDVYEGANAPVAAFVATVSKGAMVALFLRYFVASGGYASRPVIAALGLVSIASMLAGNLLALLQNNVKRILAYSSIAHLGYVLVAFVAGGPLAGEAVTFYLLAYFVTTLGAFGVIAVCSGADGDAEAIDAYRGMFWRRPWLSGVFAAMLFSLAGMPVTAGFLGKFYVVAAGMRAEAVGPVLVLVAGSAIGLFYYLRIIVVLFSREPAERPEPGPAFPPVSAPGGLALAVLMVLLLTVGVYPEPWMRLVRAAVASLVPGL